MLIYRSMVVSETSPTTGICKGRTCQATEFPINNTPLKLS